MTFLESKQDAENLIYNVIQEVTTYWIANDGGLTYAASDRESELLYALKQVDEAVSTNEIESILCEYQID